MNRQCLESLTMNMIERIKLKMRERGLEQKDLVTKLGVSKGTISNWLNDKNKGINEESLERLAKVLKTTPSYLRYGISGEEVVSMARASDEATVTEGPETMGLIPVISWIQAGAWMDAEENYYVGVDTEFMPCPVPHGHRSYALRVVGDSMTSLSGRSYPEGMVIYVDPEQPGHVGDRVIAQLIKDGRPDGVTFKQLATDGHRFYLKPLNPHHPPIFDEFRVIGKVIGGFIYD